MKTILLLLVSFFIFTTSYAQEQQGPSAEELAKANNPLAEMNALNFQNYYIPHLSEAPEQAYINNFWMRYVQPFAKGKFIMRASVPLVSNSFGTDQQGIPLSNSGLGDANVFVSYNFISGADKTIGIGPLIAAPTASNSALGSGKWQAGFAFVAFIVQSPKLQLGSLITWQASFAGDSDRDNTNLSAVQPFIFWQLGGGTYLRSASIWVFDFAKKQYHVPFSVGIGKVLKVNKTVFNIFVEPQYSILHKGTQPQLQIFTGLNMQFAK